MESNENNKKDIIEIKKTTNKQLYRDVAKITQFRISDVQECIETYLFCLEKMILECRSLKFGSIGTFDYTIIKGKPEQENVVLNPNNPEIRGTRPATKSYYKPVFKPTINLRTEIKEKTYGKTTIEE